MALDPITAALDIGSKLIDRLWQDPTQKAQAALQLLQLQQQGDLAQISGQMEIDKTEAAHPNNFVAGWRPFIGWVCGSGLAYQFIVRPLLSWIAALSGHPIAAPELDMGSLLTLLMGMLGLAGARTVEKLNGINSGH